MTRPTIVPSVLVLAFALSSCASMEMAMPFAGEAAETQSQTAENRYLQAGPRDIESAIALARSQREARDFDGATATLSQLVLLAPDDPRVLSEYGKTLVDRGETSDALAFLQRAIELNPTDWSNYSAQGVAFAQSGNFGAAQTAFGRALALKPNDPSVLNNFAMANLQAGNLDQAEKLLVMASQSGQPIPRIEQNLALVKQLRAGDSPSVPLAQATAPIPAPESVPMPAAPAIAPAVAPVIAAQSEAVASAEMPSAPFPVAVETLAAASPDEMPAEVAVENIIEAPVEDAVDVASVEAVSVQQPAQEFPLPTSATPISMAPVAQMAVASDNAVARPPVQIDVVETAELAEVDADLDVPTANIWLPESGPIYLQLAAFSVKENAVRFLDRLEAMHSQVALAYSGEREIHSVSVGPYANRREAVSALGALADLGLSDIQAVTSPIGKVLTAEELATPSAVPAVELAVELEDAPEPAPALRFSENQ